MFILIHMKNCRFPSIQHNPTEQKKGMTAVQKQLLQCRIIGVAIYFQVEISGLTSNHNTAALPSYLSPVYETAVAGAS
jgi:hypothetical protein